MEKESARNQTLKPRHERRKQVVRWYKKGIKLMQVVAMTGVSYPTVRAVSTGSIQASGAPYNRPCERLCAGGRTKDDGRELSQVQEDTLQRMIIGKRPEQLKMDFPLWSRAAVGPLIEQALGYPTASTQHRQTAHPLGLYPAKTYQACA